MANYVGSFVPDDWILSEIGSMFKKWGWNWDSGSRFAGPNPVDSYRSLVGDYDSDAHGEEAFWDRFWHPFNALADDLRGYAKYWQDVYENTGHDPKYPFRYGTTSLTSVANQIGGIAGNARSMVSDLSDLYPPEVEQVVDTYFPGMYG